DGAASGLDRDLAALDEYSERIVIGAGEEARSPDRDETIWASDPDALRRTAARAVEHQGPRVQCDVATGIHQEAIDHHAAAFAKSERRVPTEEQAYARFRARANLVSDQDRGLRSKRASLCAPHGKCLTGHARHRPGALLCAGANARRDEVDANRGRPATVDDSSGTRQRLGSLFRAHDLPSRLRMRISAKLSNQRA